MPMSYNFMVTPGAVLRPQILNGSLSLPFIASEFVVIKK